MAEAVAGETAKPFVFVDPGAFIQMFMGVGILKVKSLYRKLRKLAAPLRRRHRVLRRSRLARQPRSLERAGRRLELESRAGSCATDADCNGLAYLSPRSTR